MVQSGRQSIQVMLERWGLSATDGQMEQMRDLVKSRAIEKKSYISDDEFREIIAQVVK